MLENRVLRLAPKQSRPLTFKFELKESFVSRFTIAIVYKMESSDIERSSGIIPCDLKHRAVDQPHKVAFQHPSGIVSYAILRPPLMNGKCEQQVISLPILLNLHGAGLDADSEQVRHMLDSVPDLCSWVLFPTGVTSWSGDDWRPFLSPNTTKLY